MSTLALIGWLVAGVAAIVAAWLWMCLEDERNRSARLRIRAEEADAWADEYQRDAAALAGELDRQRERHATLLGLYGEAVRRLLAYGFVHIDRNLEWKRRADRE